MAVLSVYQPRDRKTPPLWQIFNRCHKAFEDEYDEKFEKRFGFFRAVTGESVRAYLKCGNLKQGFARIRCLNCGNDQILSFSFKKTGFLRVFLSKCRHLSFLGLQLKKNHLSGP